MSGIFSQTLSIERLTVAIADLSPSLNGIKLAQLSDLHYDGESLSEELLSDTIEFINQEKVDLVLLTGDYITEDYKPIYELAKRLKYLQSSRGIYAVLGNHDIFYPQARKKVTEALISVGIEVLWNAIATPFGEELPLVGLADYWSREFNPYPIMSSLNPNTPRIVLSHNPDTAAILQQWRVDLQLSGHTHGGQVIIPGFGPAPIILQYLRRHTPKVLQKFIPYLKECSSVVKYWEWGMGLHQVKGNLLYVNRGLGTYFPGRLFCPPELTLIQLVMK